MIHIRRLFNLFIVNPQLLQIFIKFYFCTYSKMIQLKLMSCQIINIINNDNHQIITYKIIFRFAIMFYMLFSLYCLVYSYFSILCV